MSQVTTLNHTKGLLIAVSQSNSQMRRLLIDFEYLLRFFLTLPFTPLFYFVILNLLLFSATAFISRHFLLFCNFTSQVTNAVLKSNWNPKLNLLSHLLNIVNKLLTLSSFCSRMDIQKTACQNKKNFFNS